jgi:hypothetical protein
MQTNPAQHVLEGVMLLTTIAPPHPLSPYQIMARSDRDCNKDASCIAEIFSQQLVIVQ